MRNLIAMISLHCFILASPLAHAPIRGISIVGERHSGTNFVRDLLRATLDHQPDNFFVDERVCGRTDSLVTNRQRFKHRFQFPDFNTCNLTEQLLIVMMRNPFDWSLSMKKHCWCTERGPGHSKNPFQDSSLQSFATMPWVSYDLYSPIPPVNQSYLKPTFIGHERTPGSPSFDNVLHLRACKLKNHLDISLWAPNVVYLHQEDTLETETMWKWLKGLVLNYSLPRQSNHTVPASLRAWGSPTEAVRSISEVWRYIDGSDEAAVPGVKISYLGSLGTKHLKDTGSREYDPSAAKLKSLWFNPIQLTSKDPELRQHAINVNHLMYEEIEARAGYHSLALDMAGESVVKEEAKVLKCGW